MKQKSVFRVKTAMVTVVTEGEAPGAPDYDSVHGGD